jgi:hypothetical protein
MEEISRFCYANKQYVIGGENNKLFYAEAKDMIWFNIPDKIRTLEEAEYYVENVVNESE